MSNETEKALTLLTGRLDRLERQNRYLIRTAWVLGAMLFLVLTLGAVPGRLGTKENARIGPGQLGPQNIVNTTPTLPETLDIVRTKNLQIVDNDGNVRAILGAIDDPSTPNHDEQDPGLKLYDVDGNTRAVLSLSSFGFPSLHLSDQEGKAYFRVYVGPGGMLLHATDSENHMRLESNITDLYTSFNLWDEDQQLVFSLP